ncbi:MAG: PAS domain S-box protein [Candidatus Omnitrophica bacterium]|nr:PAS domain S-box protein [Candidatus Omnitrophota bacterium]
MADGLSEKKFDESAKHAGALLDESIEKLKETRDALRESEERHRRLVQAIPDILFETTIEGKFSFLNKAVERLGYKPHEI